MHEHLSSFSYTLIGSLSNDPGFACLDWMFYFVDQVFVEIVRFMDSLKFLSTYSGILAFLYSCYFL